MRVAFVFPLFLLSCPTPPASVFLSLVLLVPFRPRWFFSDGCVSLSLPAFGSLWLCFLFPLVLVWPRSRVVLSPSPLVLLALLRWRWSLSVLVPFRAAWAYCLCWCFPCVVGHACGLVFPFLFCSIPPASVFVPVVFLVSFHPCRFCPRWFLSGSSSLALVFRLGLVWVCPAEVCFSLCGFSLCGGVARGATGDARLPCRWVCCWRCLVPGGVTSVRRALGRRGSLLFRPSPPAFVFSSFVRVCCFAWCGRGLRVIGGHVPCVVRVFFLRCLCPFPSSCRWRSFFLSRCLPPTVGLLSVRGGSPSVGRGCGR